MLPCLPFILYSIASYAILISATNGFRYVDQSCDQFGSIDAGTDETRTAMTKAQQSLTNLVNDKRVQRMIVAIFGQPPTSSEGKLWALKLIDIYEKKLTELSKNPSESNIYVYCGQSVVWSTRKPDPARDECVENFDPSNNNGQDCGVDVEEMDNFDVNINPIPGFFYAPNPFRVIGQPRVEGFENDGKWVQLMGIANGDDIPPGPYCPQPETNAFGLYSEQGTIYPHFILFCKESFQPREDAYLVDHNRNEDYFNDLDDPGAYLSAHEGSISFHILQEIGHCYGTSDDQDTADGDLAYSWSQCAKLARESKGKSVADNKALINCDSQAFFTIAMLMDRCDWSIGIARDPARVKGGAP